MTRSHVTNGTVFPATGEGAIDGGTVVLDGDAVSWVGAAADTPSADETVDCSGKTVLPGFIDAHAHLIYDEVSDPYTIELGRPLERAAIDAALNAQKLLSRGFTSIRDVGTRGNIAVTIRDAVADGRLPGPRIKASKQIISVWGGLGDMHPTHIFKREQYSAALTEIVSGPWEARDAVRQQVKDGVDWVKCEASGTGFNPLSPADRDTMSFEELQAICEEAGEKNRPVACHAESRNSIIKAARAGVTTIEHAIYLDDEGTQAVLDAGVAICPTLGLYTAFAKKGPAFGIPPEIVAAHNITHEKHVAAIRKAYDAGITLIAGSDSGLSVFPQGGGLPEVCAYVDLLGLTPAQALLTMTRDAARVVGFDDAGTLEPGKRADVVIVAGDPLSDIDVLTRDGAIETVFQSGLTVAGELN